MTNEFDSRDNGYRYTSGDQLPRDDYRPAYREAPDESGSVYYTAPAPTPKKSLFRRYLPAWIAIGLIGVSSLALLLFLLYNAFIAVGLSTFGVF